MEETGAICAGKRCAVVTGGNRGIGLEICRQLASQGILVILTARDEKRGYEAVENIKASGHSDVIFHQLDITNPASIASLADFIFTDFKRLDILVNNAGDLGVIIDPEPFKAMLSQLTQSSEENANVVNQAMKQTIKKTEECLNINYYGTKGITQALLPFLQLSTSATIVNVTSLYGQLKYISNEKIKQELNNVECLTEERLDDIVQSFLKDFKEDKLQLNGWPISISAYKVSKVAVNAYTRILARKYLNIRINCVHPGDVNTDMSCNTGSFSAEEGATPPVMLALLPNNAPSGCYFDRMDMSTFE